MSPKRQGVRFAGLDPVPIRLAIPNEASEETIFAAACMPSSLFIRTVRPYRLHQPTADTYELIIGPEGFGAVLLEALQWLARVTAAGIAGTLTSEHVSAFAQHYLEQEKPEWRFEELTEHTAAFVADRYRRATSDVDYRQALEQKRREPDFAALVAELQAWGAQRS
jgi:hypothetical protein